MLKHILQLLETYDLVMTSLAVVLASLQVLCAGVLSLLTYAWVRAKATAMTTREALREVVEVEGDGASRRLHFRVGSLFRWTVTVNPEKGVAGGNLRLDFPVRSSLALAAIYLLLASTIGVASQFIAPGIFLFFGLYHLTKWARALSTLELLASRRTVARIASTQPFSVRRTVRLAWSSYRRHALGIIFGTAKTLAISAVSLGVLAGPAHATHYAHLYRLLAPGERAERLNSIVFALARFWLSTALLVVYAALLALSAVHPITFVVAAGAFMYAFPACVLGERGVIAAFFTSASIVLRRPIANLVLLSIAIAPLAVAVLGPFGLAAAALYLSFTHVLVVTAYALQTEDKQPAAASVRDRSSEDHLRLAA